MRAAGFSRCTRRMVWRTSSSAAAVTVQVFSTTRSAPRAFAGGGKPLARKQRFERRAIGLRGPAPEVLNEEFLHYYLCWHTAGLCAGGAGCLTALGQTTRMGRVLPGANRGKGSKNAPGARAGLKAAAAKIGCPTGLSSSFAGRRPMPTDSGSSGKLRRKSMFRESPVCGVLSTRRRESNSSAPASTQRLAGSWTAYREKLSEVSSSLS